MEYVKRLSRMTSKIDVKLRPQSHLGLNADRHYLFLFSTPQVVRRRVGLG